MNTATITIKTTSATKAKAQKTAEKLGTSLSAVVNEYLKQFVKTKSTTTAHAEEEPSEYLKRTIRQAEKNLKQGNHSPTFKTGEEAVAWLEKQGI